MVHGQPLILSEVALSIYPPSSIDESWGKSDSSEKYCAFVMKSFIDRPLADQFTAGGVGLPAKKAADVHGGRTAFVLPIKEFFFYDLDWQALGVEPPEVHKQRSVGALKVVLHSFRILQEYMCFYRALLLEKTPPMPPLKRWSGDI